MSTTQERTLEINGMHCEHCVATVRSALERMQDVTVENVTVGTATVSYDDASVTTEQMATVLDEAGYELEA
jgi:copper chaperone CopZ